MNRESSPCEISLSLPRRCEYIFNSNISFSYDAATEIGIFEDGHMAI